MTDKVPITRLHPTQLTLGLAEVAERVEVLRGMSAPDIGAYVRKRTVPCVRGPGDRLFIIDRHHMCRALLTAGVSDVCVDVAADAGKLAEDEFWTYLDLHNWLHPFDADGVRQPAATLKPDIMQLVDDPYRGLAWYLRREKGYAKSKMPFEEFIWADFLRRRIPVGLLRADYRAARTAALELARSDMASHLPGWLHARQMPETVGADD